MDNTTLIDSVPLTEATRHYTTRATKEVFGSLRLENDFGQLPRRADDIGMRINAKKTQLLVIAPNNGCVTSAVMSVGDEAPIESVDRMRLVGFVFGMTPSAGPLVESITEMYKRKKWMLYHLRSAGVWGRQLYRLYCCYVRSSVEYCSAVYHAMLNRGQEEELEAIQRHAMCVCFGTDRPVEKLMAENGVETLRSRREKRCDAFVRKAWANPRFGPKWFPMRETVPWAIRRRGEVQEPVAATQRRFNSPLAFMRRRANEMRLTVA